MESIEPPVDLIETEDEVSLEEIENMDIDTLKELNLSGSYGAFGKPFKLKYLCPRCGTFKTTVVESIMNHLYSELGYSKFFCTICGLCGITYKFLCSHFKTKHKYQPPAITPLSPVNKVENWVNKLVAIQSRIINHTKNLAAPAKKHIIEKSILSETKIEEATTIIETKNLNKSESPLHSCSHCTYTCKTVGDLHKHENIHRLEKPFKCGHCSVEGVTKYEISQHSKCTHPSLQVSIISIPVSPTIKAIATKCQQRVSVTSNQSTSDISPNSKPTQTNETLVMEVQEQSVYKSFEKVNTVKNMHNKNLQRLDIQSKETSNNFEYEFCNLQSKHRQELVDYSKYMHSHLELNNLKANTISIDMEARSEDRKRYKCPECSLTSNSFPSIINDLRTHAKPLQCFYCSGRFVYPSLAKVHCAKEHTNLPAKYKTIEEALAIFKSLKESLLILENGEYVPKTSINSQKRSIPISCLETKKQKIETKTKPTARKSTTARPIKQTARKSTTQIIPSIELNDGDDEDEGFLYYGTLPNMEKDLKTSISNMDNIIKMNVRQFNSFVDIFPTVEVLNIGNCMDSL